MKLNATMENKLILTLVSHLCITYTYTLRDHKTSVEYLECKLMECRKISLKKITQ